MRPQLLWDMASPLAPIFAGGFRDTTAPKPARGSSAAADASKSAGSDVCRRLKCMAESGLIVEPFPPEERARKFEHRAETEWSVKMWESEVPQWQKDAYSADPDGCKREKWFRAARQEVRDCLRLCHSDPGVVKKYRNKGCLYSSVYGYYYHHAGGGLVLLKDDAPVQDCPCGSWHRRPI